MIDTTLLSLAQVVLPIEVLDSFEITKVESTSTEFHIHLDEKMYASLKEDIHFESKGFIPAVCITDFPIRDHRSSSIYAVENGLIVVQAKVLSFL